MPPTTGSESSTCEPNGRYPTRYRGRQEKAQAKYDDIFSSVFEKVTGSNMNQLSCELIRPLTVKARTGKQSRTRAPTGTYMYTFKDHNSYKCRTCRFSCRGHLELHKHICLTHTKDEKCKCHVCASEWERLREIHVCAICQEFFPKLEEHVKTHYLTKTGANALLECLRCFKAFKHMDELREHEKVHSSGPTRVFPCQLCDESFTRRYCREYHILTHFNTVLDSAFITVEKMQEQFTDGLMPHQCPMCLCNMSSRKSFRMHVIHKHLLADISSLELLCGQLADPSELCKLRFYITNRQLPVKEDFVEFEEVEEKAGARLKLEPEADSENKIEQNHPADFVCSLVKEELTDAVEMRVDGQEGAPTVLIKEEPLDAVEE